MRRILSVVGILGVVAALSSAPAAAVQPGDPAPDFTLRDIHGTPYTLSALRGQLVLLWFLGYG